ncbi:MAG: hypothetical protein JWL67_1768 [Solirubrobacterales bacterium]|nr:hypothetical protein [Solirubrobacterales bacterium]
MCSAGGPSEPGPTGVKKGPGSLRLARRPARLSAGRLSACAIGPAARADGGALPYILGRNEDCSKLLDHDRRPSPVAPRPCLRAACRPAGSARIKDSWRREGARPARQREERVLRLPAGLEPADVSTPRPSEAVWGNWMSRAEQKRRRGGPVLTSAPVRHIGPRSVPHRAGTRASQAAPLLPLRSARTTP